MRLQTIKITLPALFLGAAFCLGCHDGLDLRPVTGVVTLDGQPLADAAVLFVPTAGGPAASAATDAEGRFTLNTTNDPGALIGEHRVAVVKQKIHNVVDGVAGPGGARVEWLAPERYSRPETSGLTARVPEDGKLRFELTSP